MLSKTETHKSEKQGTGLLYTRSIYTPFILITKIFVIHQFVETPCHDFENKEIVEVLKIYEMQILSVLLKKDLKIIIKKPFMSR